MKAMGILLIAACAVFAVSSRSDYKPYNSHVIFEDSVWIDSTEVKTMEVFWQDNYAQKAVLVEARDDSSDGFASDSYSVKIEVYQDFPLTNDISGKYNRFPYFVHLPSRAHPDSSTYPYGTDFILFDSLDILDMDTLAVYVRDSIPVTNSYGDTVDWAFGDSLKTAQESGFGAFAYQCVSFDYTPGLSFKITGLTRNRIAGVGTLTRIRMYGLDGAVTKGK